MLSLLRILVGLALSLVHLANFICSLELWFFIPVNFVLLPH